MAERNVGRPTSNQLPRRHAPLAEAPAVRCTDQAPPVSPLATCHLAATSPPQPRPRSSPPQVVQAERQLRDLLIRDGLRAAAGYQLARYNDPSTPPMVRRNEVLIRLDDFAWP